MSTTPDPLEITGLQVRQRLTMMVNRYEIRRPDGQLLAMAQQKRMAFKEQVTFYADEGRSQPVFGFKARTRMDLGATYDVTDATGAPIGLFRKDFAKSLLRSTWHVEVPAQGLRATGQERSSNVALARRFMEMLPVVGEIPVPWVFHFDFATADGIPVLSSTKKWGVRDHYTIDLPAAPNGARLDWRVAASVAVALDALQSR